MDPMQNDDREQKQGLERQVEELREQLAALQEAAGERAAQAYEVVKDNPGTSMLVAAVFAGIIGFALGQQMESERNQHRSRWY